MGKRQRQLAKYLVVLRQPLVARSQPLQQRADLGGGQSQHLERLHHHHGKDYDQAVTAANPTDATLPVGQASTLFPAERYSSCPVAMKGLNYDWASSITIYTIQVNTNGDPTSTLLQNCARSYDNLFLLTNASDFISVFNNIGTNLTKLRVAK